MPPRLGIRAGRDNRKILTVPALDHQQAEVMAGPARLAGRGPRGRSRLRRTWRWPGLDGRMHCAHWTPSKWASLAAAADRPGRRPDEAAAGQLVGKTVLIP